MQPLNEMICLQGCDQSYSPLGKREARKQTLMVPKSSTGATCLVPECHMTSAKGAEHELLARNMGTMEAE